MTAPLNEADIVMLLLAEMVIVMLLLAEMVVVTLGLLLTGTEDVVVVLAVALDDLVLVALLVLVCDPDALQVGEMLLHLLDRGTADLQKPAR